MNTLSKLFRLRVIRQLTLHPNRITVRRIGNRPVNRTLTTTLQPIVPLPRSRAVPVPGDIDTSDPLGNSTRLGIALPLHLLQEASRELFLVDVHPGRDGINDGGVEELQTSLSCPRVLDGLEFGTVLACCFGGDHEVVQRLERRIRGAEDVGVVAGIDGSGDESGSFGICSCDGEEIGAHDICLSTDGNQTVDVLRDGDQNLSSHVSALLGSGSLILNVNTSSSLLNEELGELHDRCQASMSSISICDDGSEVVDILELASVCFRFCGDSLLALLSIVEELGHEEMADLVWYSGLDELVLFLVPPKLSATHVWVICQIWTWLV